MGKSKKAYARAGVDVDLGNKLKRRIQSLVKQTHGPRVLGKIGGFGGLFRANFPGMRDPVLVASIDGVGTKLKIDFALNQHDTVCAVDCKKMIDGHKIKPGDVVLGMPSNGLHTNGYSLARKVLPRSRKIDNELLRTHKNYQPLLAKAPDGMIKGLAHITGGGLIDNLPRVLPKNCDAVIETKSWRVPEIFKTIQRNGNVDRREMYQVFNMGIGMVAIVSEHDAKRAMSILKAKRIGRIEKGSGRTRLVF